MKPEELEAALQKLWVKVAEPQQSVGAPISPPIFEVEPTSRGAAIEALGLVKRQFREQRARWQSTLELKEADLVALADSLRRAEAEIGTLRRRAQLFDARLVEEISALAQQLEGARQALQDQERRAQIEEKRLGELLEQQAAQNRLLREGQVAIRAELDELGRKAARSEEGGKRLERENDSYKEALKEGRDAVAATLSELLSERQSRELAEERAEHAERQLKELSERLSRIEKLWHEERRQWGELWDRERSESK